MKIGITYDVNKVDGERAKKFNDFRKIEDIHCIKKELEKTDNIVTLIGNERQLMQQLLDGTFDCEIVLNTIGGISAQNRGNSVPAILDDYKIPYIGSDAFGLSLASNKYLTRMVARSHGINTPNSVLLSYPNTEDMAEKISTLKPPYGVQLNYAINSREIILCYDPQDAAKKAEDLMERYQDDVICEEFKFAMDMEVPYIDTKSIPLWDITYVETKPHYRRGFIGREGIYFWDYRADKETRALFEEPVNILYKNLGIRDLCCFDFRMTPTGELIFAGVNPVPAIMDGSVYEAVGKKYGYRYYEMLHLVLEAACERLNLPYFKI